MHWIFFLQKTKKNKQNCPKFIETHRCAQIEQRPLSMCGFTLTSGPCHCIWHHVNCCRCVVHDAESRSLRSNQRVDHATRLDDHVFVACCFLVHWNNTQNEMKSIANLIRSTKLDFELWLALFYGFCVEYSLKINLSFFLENAYLPETIERLSNFLWFFI